MPARKKKMANNVGLGRSTKQMKRKKPYNVDQMVAVEPITANQKIAFESYKEGKNLFLYGAAGTGKTFITLYNALKDVLDPITPYNKVVIVRSLVSTREIGFLPGDHEDKSFLYQIPYKNMVKYMFELPTDQEFEMLIGDDGIGFHPLDESSGLGTKLINIFTRQLGGTIEMLDKKGAFYLLKFRIDDEF